MPSYQFIFAIVYVLAVVGLGVYLIVLAARFVKAHQRGAVALEAIARNLEIRKTGD